MLFNLLCINHSFRCLSLMIRQCVRNIIYYIYSYQLFRDFVPFDNTVFFIIDESRKHPGFADRLKAIVCVYYIAKINGYKFKLIFSYPFKLHKYLEPNEVDWLSVDGTMSYSLMNTRLLSYRGYGHIPILNKKVKQYHVYNYVGKNILENNGIENWELIWGNCFKELFEPTNLMKKIIEDQEWKENAYIAVHIRFVNALGHFESGENVTLNSAEKKKLINRCLCKLLEIKKINSLPILIFSDSNLFLNIAKENGYSILDGEVIHISNTIGEEDVQKTLLDFFMISRAKKVYSIIGYNLYTSAFSKYAALAGVKIFKSVKL